MVFDLSINLGNIVSALLAVSGAVTAIIWRASRVELKFEMIGNQQAAEIKEIKLAVDKLEGVVQLVAVQKDQIQTIRDTQMQNTRRTDETFTRIFGILDALRQPR